MSEWIAPLFTTEALLALVALTAMEIVLGIDNIIFLAIIAGRLPLDQQPRARRIGLLVALGTRLLLLAAVGWVMTLKEALFTLPHWIPIGEETRAISGKDLIMLVGGLFLIAKSTHEIHHKLEGEEVAGQTARPAGRAGFVSVIIQIALVDIIFSLDSVITGVGMIKDASQIGVIVIAMFITVGVMMVAATPISDFVAKHPTIKILALSFLILIGVVLVAEGLGGHLDKGYIYFAMAFSLVVELINMRIRGKEPVKLHERQIPPTRS